MMIYKRLQGAVPTDSTQVLFSDRYPYLIQPEKVVSQDSFKTHTAGANLAGLRAPFPQNAPKTWQQGIVGGAAQVASTGDGLAVVTSTASTAGAALEVGQTDHDALVLFRASDLVSTFSCGVLLRWVADNTSVSIIVRSDTNKLQIQKRAGSPEVVTDVPFEVAAGELYALRGYCRGTTFTGVIWRVGSTDLPTTVVGTISGHASDAGTKAGLIIGGSLLASGGRCLEFSSGIA